MLGGGGTILILIVFCFHWRGFGYDLKSTIEWSFPSLLSIFTESGLGYSESFDIREEWTTSHQCYNYCLFNWLVKAEWCVKTVVWRCSSSKSNDLTDSGIASVAAYEEMASSCSEMGMACFRRASINFDLCLNHLTMRCYCISIFLCWLLFACCSVDVNVLCLQQKC